MWHHMTSSNMSYDIMWCATCHHVTCHMTTTPCSWRRGWGVYSWRSSHDSWLHGPVRYYSELFSSLTHWPVPSLSLTSSPPSLIPANQMASSRRLLATRSSGGIFPSFSSLLSSKVHVHTRDPIKICVRWVYISSLLSVSLPSPFSPSFSLHMKLSGKQSTGFVKTLTLHESDIPSHNRLLPLYQLKSVHMYTHNQDCIAV